jgi:hypothetical protein
MFQPRLTAIEPGAQSAGINDFAEHVVHLHIERLRRLCDGARLTLVTRIICFIANLILCWVSRDNIH